MTTRRTRGRTTERPSRSEKKRIPVSGSNRDLLGVVGKDENYVYRWVNGTDSRIMRFKEGGWDLVEHNVTVGERSSDTAASTSSLITKDGGKGVTLYLMRILRDFYDEDQVAKRNRINKTEDTMKRSLNSGQDGTYGKVDFED